MSGVWTCPPPFSFLENDSTSQGQKRQKHCLFRKVTALVIAEFLRIDFAVANDVAGHIQGHAWIMPLQMTNAAKWW